jgi:hypothetical protein
LGESPPRHKTPTGRGILPSSQVAVKRSEQDRKSNGRGTLAHRCFRPVLELGEMEVLAARRAVFEVSAQRKIRAGKGDVRPGDVFCLDKMRLEALRPGSELRLRQLCAKNTWTWFARST